MRKHPIGEVIQLDRVSTFVRIAPPHITSGLPTTRDLTAYFQGFRWQFFQAISAWPDVVLALSSVGRITWL
jgi:hypothetical protein